MIFGNKQNFAVEFSDPHLLRSRTRLWIGGIPLGNFEEEEYVLGMILGLKLPYALNEMKCDVLDTLTLDKLINEEDDYDDQLYLNMGESFDDFIIRVCRCSDYIYFYWKLASEPFFDYSYPYSGDYMCSVSIDKHMSLISDIENCLLRS